MTVARRQRVGILCTQVSDAIPEVSCRAGFVFIVEDEDLGHLQSDALAHPCVFVRIMLVDDLRGGLLIFRSVYLGILARFD